MGISMTLRNNDTEHLLQFKGLIASGRAFIDKVRVIWFACIWCNWRSRNAKLLKNKEINVFNMVEFMSVDPGNWLKIKSSVIDYNFTI